MKFLTTTLLVLACTTLQSQDTIRIMQYNLLNYGNNYGDCNSGNNNVDDKNQYLKVITGYLQPDIMLVNEMADDSYYHDYLLNNVLNTNGVTSFERADLPNLGGSPIMNQVYYNAQLFSIQSNAAIETNYRDIDVIAFNYTGSGQANPVAFFAAVAHLKAGNDPEDATERAAETALLMDHIQANGLDGNFLLSGDFNLYSGSEAAFQNLLLFPDENLRFYDPVFKVGEWHANSFFADIHTQSTHLEGGCPAGGGLDDRFDFILVSEEILEGSDGMKYIPGSYLAAGQDGGHFDQSLISPANNSVPPAVLEALYHMSDHLPLVIDVQVSEQAGIVRDHRKSLLLSYASPASGEVPVTITTADPGKVLVRLFDQVGNRVWSKDIKTDTDGSARFTVPALPAGLYIIQASVTGNYPVSSKLIVTGK